MLQNPVGRILSLWIVICGPVDKEWTCGLITSTACQLWKAKLFTFTHHRQAVKDTRFAELKTCKLKHWLYNKKGSPAPFSSENSKLVN